MFARMTPDEQQREIARLDDEQYKQEATARLGIQESLGLAAIKAVTLINGGAMIALFTFIGNASKTVNIDVSMLWSGFIFFTSGLALAVLANLLGYLMQVQFYVATIRQAWNAQRLSVGDVPNENVDGPFKIATWLGAAAISSTAAGLIAFCIGAGCALGGVTAVRQQGAKVPESARSRTLPRPTQVTNHY